MRLEGFYNGKAHRVMRYVVASGRSPVDDYLESLTAREQDKMVALIKYAADEGPPFGNRQKCKPVEGYKLNEFKLHGPRIIWCWGPGRAIVLLHGFTKRQDRIPASELNVANGRYADVAAMTEKGGSND